MMPMRSDAYDKKLASCSVPRPIRKLGAKKFSFTFAELGDPFPFKDIETDGQSQSSMDCGSSHLSEESFDRQYQVYKSYSDSDDLDNLVLYNTVGRFSGDAREVSPFASRSSDSRGRSRVTPRQDERSPVGLSYGQSMGRGRDYGSPCDRKQNDYSYEDNGNVQNKSLEEEAQRPEVMALINKYKPFSYSEGSLKKGHNGVVITPRSKGQGHDCTTPAGAAAAAIGHGNKGSQQRHSAEKQHGNSVGWVLSKKPDITKSDKRQSNRQLFSKTDSNSGSLDGSGRSKSPGHHATSLDLEFSLRKHETKVEHRKQGQSQGVENNHREAKVSSSPDTSFQMRANSAGDHNGRPNSMQPVVSEDLPRLGDRQFLRPRLSEDEWNTNQVWQSSPRSMDDFSVTAPSDSSDRSSRIDPQVYQSYAAGLLHSSYRSNRFMRLQNYYSLLERIAAIEGRTLAKNAVSGKGRFNLVNLRSKSLGSLAPQSKADNILLSKYDVNNIWELKEMYADLEEAQDEEQFLFDAGRVEDFQWNPWEDWGIQNKKLSTQQLQFMFEKGLNQNTQASLRKLYRGTDVDFRREMSFRKLYEKYKHLDEETRRQRIIDEWGWRKHRSRRSSDSSSMFSCGSSMTGTYLELMEKAAEKARQRAIYGYHIPEEYNSYEKHVQRMKKLTRSCPDINRLLKDKGRRSACRGSSRLSHDVSLQNEEGHPSSGTMPRSRSEHHLSPKTGKTERTKDDLDCTTKTTQSRTKLGELLRQELGEVNSLVVDGQKQVRKWNETTPPWKSHKSGSRRAVGSSENCVDGRQTDQLSQRSAEKGDSGLNMSWDDSFESEEPLPSHKRRTRTRSQGKSSWRSEVRGVVGAMTKTEDEVKCKEPVRVPPRKESLEQKLENFRQKHGWRKDSKPDPGTVSRALNVFQAMEEEQIVPQHQEPLVGDGNPSLPRRRQEAETASLHMKHHVSAVNEERIKQQHQEPLIGDGSPSLTRRRREAENESLHLKHRFSAVDEDVILPQHQEPLIGDGNPSLARRRREAEIEFWKTKHQISGAEDFTSTYHFQRSKSLSAKHEQGLQKHSTSPSLRTHPLQSYKSESELSGKSGRKSDAFLQAKNRFEEMAVENELASYPKTGLPSKSQKTALGRYEARIRGQSEMRVSPAQGRLCEEKKSKSIEYDRFQEELRNHSHNTDELSTASWKSKEASLEQHIRSRVDMTQRSSTDPSKQYSDIHEGRDSPDWDEPESPSDGRISRLDKREDDASSCDYNDGDLTDVKRPFESRHEMGKHSYNLTASGNNKELILVRYPQNKEQSASSQNSPGMYETDLDTSTVQPYTRQHDNNLVQCTYVNQHGQRTLSGTESTPVQNTFTCKNAKKSYESLDTQQLGERTKMAIISPNTFSEDKPVVPVEPTNNTKRSPVGDDAHFGMTQSQRSYSASVLTTDGMMTDPTYGDLSKWSRLNVTDGLERGEDESGQLQKWGPTCLNIATMSSNETFIIKDSDPEMSPRECSRSFSGRLPSQYEDERPGVFYDASQEVGGRAVTRDKQESTPNRHWGKDKTESAVKPVGIPFRRKVENAKTSNLNEEPMCYTWKREYDVPPNVDIDEVRKGGINKDSDIYRSLGVIRNFTKEAGPQDFYNDLERLGKEWQKDTDKKQTRQSAVPFSHQYRRPEGIGAGSRPLPEYRPPPCYVHPWLEQEPDYQQYHGPPHQSTLRYSSNISRQPYYCMPYPSHSNRVLNQQRVPEHSLPQSKSCPEIVPNNREAYTSSEMHRAFPLAEPHFQSSHQVSHLPLAGSHGMQNQMEKHHGDMIPTNQSDHAQTATQSNIPRQRHSVSGTGHSPTGSWDNRRRRDEEAARRKQEMKRITAQEKLKRMEEERKANEARRHNDFLTPSQKSPIPLNRYDDVPDISDLQRPKKKVGTQYRGKARALYNFKAQNPKELSFKKNDIIYLLRQIDKNWYEGEHHGLVGLFPVNYVEVLMSLDEARQAAILREGHAKAKYNFTAQSAMEVSFKKGDTVSLIRRIDNNWFEGRVNGRHGIFPVSYVEVLREPDTPLPTPMSSYAPTPATGSPGQLSPVSTISNGPAPTIPSAPISPRSSVDNFDFGQPFNYSQYPSSTTSLQRPSRRDQSYADYGLDPLNPMRPASALGGLSDGYGTVPRDRYNQANRPNSAVPFSDYLKNSARDSGFYSSEESRYSRQKHREEELMRSLSNPYEGRQSSAGSQSRDSFSRGEELRYPPYQALYSYRPQNPDELELREGDIVYVMEKCDDDWYVGTSQRTKEFGTFPGNYVRQL